MDKELVGMAIDYLYLTTVRDDLDIEAKDYFPFDIDVCRWKKIRKSHQAENIALARKILRSAFKGSNIAKAKKQEFIEKYFTWMRSYIEDNLFERHELSYSNNECFRIILKAPIENKEKIEGFLSKLVYPDVVIFISS